MVFRLNRELRTTPARLATGAPPALVECTKTEQANGNAGVRAGSNSLPLSVN
jgi:hypothetical protein